jgi:hypothetical protein
MFGKTSENNSLIGARNVEVELMIRSISANLDRPLVDRTGLDGPIDFRLEWTDEGPLGPGGWWEQVLVQNGVDTEALALLPRISFEQAVRDQLAMELEATEAPITVLVFDSVEWPSEFRWSAVSVNLTTISESQQINDVLRAVERVDDAIVTDPQAIAILPFEPVVRECIQPEAHIIDLVFYAGSDLGGKLEKRGIETGIVDLKRSPHARLGLASSWLEPLGHLAFRLPDALFEFRCELQVVLDQIVEAFTDLAQLGLRQFLQLRFDLVDSAHIRQSFSFADYTRWELSEVPRIISLLLRSIWSSGLGELTRTGVTTSTNSSIAAGDVTRTRRPVSAASASWDHQPLIRALIRTEVSRIVRTTVSPGELHALRHQSGRRPSIQLP